MPYLLDVESMNKKRITKSVFCSALSALVYVLFLWLEGLIAGVDMIASYMFLALPIIGFWSVAISLFSLAFLVFPCHMILCKYNNASLPPYLFMGLILSIVINYFVLGWSVNSFDFWAYIEMLSSSLIVASVYWRLGVKCEDYGT